MTDVEMKIVEFQIESAENRIRADRNLERSLVKNDLCLITAVNLLQ